MSKHKAKKTGHEGPKKPGHEGHKKPGHEVLEPSEVLPPADDIIRANGEGFLQIKGDDRHARPLSFRVVAPNSTESLTCRLGVVEARAVVRALARSLRMGVL